MPLRCAYQLPAVDLTHCVKRMDIWLIRRRSFATSRPRELDLARELAPFWSLHVEPPVGIEPTTFSLRVVSAERNSSG